MELPTARLSLSVPADRPRGTIGRARLCRAEGGPEAAVARPSSQGVFIYLDRATIVFVTVADGSTESRPTEEGDRSEWNC